MLLMVKLFNWEKIIAGNIDDNSQTLNPVYEEIQSLHHGSLLEISLMEKVTIGYNYFFITYK